MIHFRVNEALNLVEIFAVLHTSLDPKWDVESNEERKDFL